jgi:hypothetical protein
VGFGVVFHVHALSVEPYSLAPYPEIAKPIKPTIGKVVPGQNEQGGNPCMLSGSGTIHNTTRSSSRRMGRSLREQEKQPLMPTSISCS